MPTIEVDKNDLEKLLGKKLGKDQENIADMLFDIKCELDRVDGDTLYIEVEHDRVDLLSTEGIARAIKGYLGLETGLIEYKVLEPKVIVHYDPSALKSRQPISKQAIVRGVELDDVSVKQMMQLQEKLDSVYCNNRELGAMGTYDMDKIVSPITYKAVDPKSVEIIPLGTNEKMTCAEVLSKHTKGTEFADLFKDYDTVPVYIDGSGKCIGLIPITNSEDTKVTEKTKNIFIDVTGRDERIVEMCLALVCTELVERGGTIEAVKQIHPDGERIYPELKYPEMNVEPMYVNKTLGLSLDIGEMQRLVRKQRFGCEQNSGQLKVTVPAYRFDIMHAVDIIEDIAVAYGYNNFKPVLPNVATIGALHENEKKENKMRQAMIGLGFQEVATFMLSNYENITKKIMSEERAIKLLNPMSEEYNSVRNSIIPKLLEVFAANKHHDLPQKIFETGEVVLITNKGEVKTKTEQRIAGAIISHNAGFTEIKSVLESLSKNVGLELEYKELEHEKYISGRAASVLSKGKSIGEIGEIHPQVLENFDLQYAMAVFELVI